MSDNKVPFTCWKVLWSFQWGRYRIDVSRKDHENEIDLEDHL